MGRVDAVAHTASSRRWELYRLLGEPVRLRLLALAAIEELAVGELAELLGESQPNVSRHVKALRSSGLLSVRKQGRWVLVRLTDGVNVDPVVGDALDAGRVLAEDDGSLGRVAALVAARDEASRAFFLEPEAGDATPSLPPELPAYLSAIAPLIEARRLAVDVGTGEGGFLDVLAPIFEEVIAVDRSQPQLERARRRLAARGYGHVSLHPGELDDPALRDQLAERGGADAVFASRVLHHVPKPVHALAALAALAKPGGAVVVVDYASHHDERLREQQADLWLGFTESELRELAQAAGLGVASLSRIPSTRCGDGPDGHLDWQVLVARTKR